MAWHLGAWRHMHVDPDEDDSQDKANTPPLSLFHSLVCQACTWAQGGLLLMRCSGRQVVVQHFVLGTSAALQLSVELGVNQACTA